MPMPTSEDVVKKRALHKYVHIYTHISETLLRQNKTFMRTRSVCVTYALCKYVTSRTFNVLKVFAAVQQMRQVNLII